MIYVGSELRAANGGITDPALIDPSLKIARHGDCRQRQFSYWPSFSAISPEARRAYLEWLAGGRQQADCDIGYVFLFFYGLERRVLFDALTDPEARSDLLPIRDELERLLRVYARASGSFDGYATRLLDWIQVDAVSARAYEQPVWAVGPTREPPFPMRVALGQAAIDQVPVPATLASAWVLQHPGIQVRPHARRHEALFRTLFGEHYGQRFGSGLLLPRNKTKLKIGYHPASAGLHGTRFLLKDIGAIPDVMAVTAPLKPLQEIVDRCCKDLGPYARFVVSHPNSADALDAVLLLPLALWPAASQAKLHALAGRIQETQSMRFSELLSALGADQRLPRDKVIALARALEHDGVGMEPDVIAGAKQSAVTDPVVLFRQPAGERAVDSGAVRGFSLMLQLASAMAWADGEFSPSEVAFLRREVDRWDHLDEPQRRRMHAHLQWLATVQISLASLRSKLALLDRAARQTVAGFMTALAQADGVVSPSEVKFLEKAYKALELDPATVFSSLHAAGAAGPVATQRIVPARGPTSTSGLVLDPARIAALQQDTAKVSALLEGIFRDEEPAAVGGAAASEPPEEAATPEPGLVGLDAEHSALLRVLCSRTQWSRADLEDAASDLQLMLDGALERINEATLDAYEQPLTEGEDPVDINTQVIERIAA